MECAKYIHNSEYKFKSYRLPAYFLDAIESGDINDLTAEQNSTFWKWYKKETATAWDFQFVYAINNFNTIFTDATDILLEEIPAKTFVFRKAELQQGRVKPPKIVNFYVTKDLSELFAVFPESIKIETLVSDIKYTSVLSYSNSLKHKDVPVSFFIEDCFSAPEIICLDLIDELLSIGYNLQITKLYENLSLN